MKTITINKITLALKPRSAYDVIATEEYRKTEQAEQMPALLMASMIHQALTHHLKEVPWWNLPLYFKLKRTIEPASLLVNLSLNQLAECVKHIHQIEKWEAPDA